MNGDSFPCNLEGLIMAKADLHSVELVKIKIQGKKSHLKEFKQRLTDNLDELDCQLLNETPIFPNMKNVRENHNPLIWRQYIFLGLNRRETNAKEKK